MNLEPTQSSIRLNAKAPIPAVVLRSKPKIITSFILMPNVPAAYNPPNANRVFIPSVYNIRAKRKRESWEFLGNVSNVLSNILSPLIIMALDGKSLGCSSAVHINIGKLNIDNHKATKGPDILICSALNLSKPKGAISACTNTNSTIVKQVKPPK